MISMPDTDEKRAIEATVQAYIDAIKFTQPERMKEVFHPHSTISRHKPEGFVISTNPGESICKFMQSVPPTLQTSPNFEGEILSVDQAGDIAAARIAERNLEGKNFDTFFLLHKVDGRWLITSKATRGVPIQKN
jgi:hypothetical protein